MTEGGGYQETLQELQNPGLQIFLDNDFKTVSDNFMILVSCNALFRHRRSVSMG